MIALLPSENACWVDIAASIGAVRRQCPAAAIVLRVDDMLPSQRLGILIKAVEEGVSAWTESACVSAESIRIQTTDQDHFVRTTRAWLLAREAPISPAVLQLVTLMAARAFRFRQLSEFAAANGLPPSTIRRRFAVAGVAPPSRWLKLFRALAIALEIQRVPQCPLASIAEQFGMFDAAAVRRTLGETLGANASAARMYLGSEWLLHTGVRRMRLFAQMRR